MELFSSFGVLGRARSMLSLSTGVRLTPSVLKDSTFSFLKKELSTIVADAGSLRFAADAALAVARPAQLKP